MYTIMYFPVSITPNKIGHVHWPFVLPLGRWEGRILLLFVAALKIYYYDAITI